MKRFIPLTAAIAIVLSACGGSGSSTPTETVPAGALVVKAVSGLRFDASKYGPVAAGDITFSYVNEDSMRHTLIVSKDSKKVGVFKLAVLRNGDIDTGTINLTAGEYTLICDVPGHGNMKATLTVE